MSGIRAHDPKLLALGLTLPGFVERSKTIASLPSLGLLYLAACTPAVHDVQYFEAEADGNEPREVYLCDLVAISTFSAQVFEAYAIADHLRHAGVLHDRLLREGRILEPGRWDLCTLFDVNYMPSGMTPQQLKEGMCWLTERLYNDECTRYRRQAFFAFVREHHPCKRIA